MSTLDLEETLNTAQLQAVCAPLGRLLVLAGAGSGKTRVLVYRIAWLMAKMNASPYSILAVTFTNKAAHEMRGRIETLLQTSTQGLWVGTFHGLAHKMLRLHPEACGLSKTFQVIDSDDQLRLVRKTIKALNINEDRFEPKKAQHYINRKKDEGRRAHQVTVNHNPYEEVLLEIYQHYEQTCHAQGLVDFAEILLRSYELLQNNPDLLQHYQARFQHVLVDEFQDTNAIQYAWLSLLAGQAQSMTVVGDDDQSIYGWRGAKVENIQRFEKEFPGTEVVRLEQNYRSTETILAAANAIIDHNASRFGKTLWTQGEKGDPITLYNALNEEDEALFVVRRIQDHLNEGGKPCDIGILYRSNAQSRILEEALLRSGIDYHIYGGLRFFERAEIKDALAYLRLALNPEDSAAFDRALNMPPRGIGDRSYEKLKIYASENQLNLWQTAKMALDERIVSGRAMQGLTQFIQIVDELHRLSREVSLAELVEDTIHRSGLLLHFKEQRGEKAQSKAENLEELVHATSDFAEHATPVEQEDNLLVAFLSHATLEAGEHQANRHQSAVQLMTLHAAKGLEFPVVFICGMEDGLFPHQFSIENPNGLEEERRLCYVGVTRARQKLTLTCAERRRIFGREEARTPSRFLYEIPSHLKEEIGRQVKVETPSYLRFADAWETGSQSVGAGLSFAKPASTSGIALGQRVRHAKFGTGTVIDHEGEGEKARVHVHFDSVGPKWLLLNLANLATV